MSAAKIEGCVLHADMPTPTARNHEQEANKYQAQERWCLQRSLHSESVWACNHTWIL